MSLNDDDSINEYESEKFASALCTVASSYPSTACPPFEYYYSFDSDNLLSITYLMIDDNYYLYVVHEIIPATIFGRRVIQAWLRLENPESSFTIQQIDKCYVILSLILRKATFYNCDSNTIGYHTKYINEGIFEEKRISMIMGMYGNCASFNKKPLVIICYDGNCEEPAFETNGLTIKEKQNPKYRKCLEFNLTEILESEWAYECVMNYFQNLPDFEQTRSILSFLGIPNEIIYKIVGYLTDEELWYPSGA
jgi:hypothetical protein